MAHAELDRLQACLNSALDTLRKEMNDSQLPPLSQHSSVEHPLDDPNFLPSARLFEARRLSLACMGELKNLIQSPLDRCFEDKLSTYGIVCIDMLIHTGIVDYLADVPNPSQGVPVAELAAKLELDSKKIIPILRCSAANGWVRETRDSSFALNRCSRILIKGQPGWKLVALPGFMTLVETVSHWVTESEWKLSRSPLQTAFQIAYKTPLSAFSWLIERPKLFIHVAGHFQVFGDTSTPSVIADYPWTQLETPVIVDCGGGQGGLVSAILDAHPSFEVIVQDMEDMVAVTGSIMQERRPIQIESGVLKVEAHDLFQPQPRIGNEYSFILRHIMHDWPDEEASQATILSHLARALGPKSKILIIDIIVVPNVDATATTTINSLSHERADYIIPSHFGSASKIISGSSMHMMAMFNSYERSMNEWEKLVRVSGLRITNVYPLRAQASIIECALDS
ncbi:S-adenosyl-L-methionine-dependent methyltransferase [Rhizopogon vinicolor AM-OR11-026]|uniref:S-adenosyl-L-methionine-dependent methyltransferase n=1 Tax=Rhizopogon vinicolor AM-OR11-026 TaxID=1314800 RepID=A0A1B7MR68_9AGAM|nr:S-adenosyl-L-methionine-dependent methyltransferase [Rhizopogon vinicolor AM-OR11-026]